MCPTLFFSTTPKTAERFTVLLLFLTLVVQFELEMLRNLFEPLIVAVKPGSYRHHLGIPILRVFGDGGGVQLSCYQWVQKIQNFCIRKTGLTRACPSLPRLFEINPIAGSVLTSRSKASRGSRESESTYQASLAPRPPEAGYVPVRIA